MSVGEVLWAVLMGFIFVWAADLFGLWDRWQTNIEHWLVGRIP